MRWKSDAWICQGKGTEPLGTSSRDGQGPDEFRFDFVRGLTSPGKGHITRAPPFDRLRRRPDRYCVQRRAPFPSLQKAVAASGPSPVLRGWMGMGSIEMVPGFVSEMAL